MSETYEINESNRVVPYTSGRKCTDTRAWRDATELELQQQEQISQLERELAEARDQLAGAGKLMKACDVLVRDLAEARKQRDTLAEAAQAVVDRWDAPTWKDLEPTAKVMNALRNALAAVKGGSHE